MDLPLSDYRKMAVAEFDTTKLLAHAAQQAKERGYEMAANVSSRRVSNSGALIASDQPDSLAAAIDAFAKQVLAAKK